MAEYSTGDLAYDMHCSDLQQELEDEHRWFKFWFNLQERAGNSSAKSRNSKRISISRDGEKVIQEMEAMLKSLHHIEGELISIKNTLNSKY